MDKYDSCAFIELMDRFDDVHVLVVGDLMVDEYLWGHVGRISPEAPVPVVEVRDDSWVPGGAANVAANLRALGANVILAGIVGDDGAGRQLVDKLDSMGINTECIVADTDRPTTQKTRVVAKHQQVARIDREDRTPISEPVMSKLIQSVESALNSVEVIVIEDYGKGVVTAGMCKSVVRTAGETQKPVIVDPKERRFRMYRGATLITPNLHEAADATDIEEHNDDGTVEWIGRRLKEMLGCETVLITRGEKGMSFITENGMFVTIPTVAREVFDVSGAGDTVVATISAATAAGCDIETACALATHAASCVVAKLGTATVTRAEIRESFDNMDGRTSTDRRDT